MSQMATAPAQSLERSCALADRYRTRPRGTAAEGVARISFELGVAFGLVRAEPLELTVGAFLHDVGKLAILSSVLEKPCGLS